MPLSNIDPERRRNLQLAFQYICDTFGVPYTKDSAEHMMVFLEALQIYGERTKKYGDIWKNAGAIQAFYDAHRKARRIHKVWGAEKVVPGEPMLAPTNLDDAFDAINYLIFGIRNARELRIYEREEEDEVVAARRRHPSTPKE